MPITWRRRGQTIYVRGSVRVGSETRVVKEHSSGSAEPRFVEEEYIPNLQEQVRREILYGAAGRAKSVTFGNVVVVYAQRPEGLHPNDKWRLREMNEILGDYPVANLPQKWPEFVAARCQGLAPSTVDRFRAVLQAALHYASAPLAYDCPRIKPIRFNNKRVRFLSVEEADRLCDAYDPHARPIALFLRFTGARVQEALQLQREHLDMVRGTAWFPRTKSGNPRTVALHPRVRVALAAMFEAQEERRKLGKRIGPAPGHVFLNRIGRPYADTRDYKMPGGNPLRAVHRAACKRAGIVDFRAHDWRHTFAAHMVMAGVDLETIMRVGGWKDVRSVMRYVAVSDEHMGEAVARMR